MSSINLVISEEDNKLKSALSLILHNSFTVAASDIYKETREEHKSSNFKRFIEH